MNKNIYSLLFILCFVCPPRINAQEAAAGSAAWLLTIETIKAKSGQLMEQNTLLTADRNMLVQDINQLNVFVAEQETKNTVLADFLKDRHGRTDQQARAQELEAQIKDKRVQLERSQKDSDSLKTQAAALERRVKLKQLRLSDWDLRQNSQALAVETPKPATELDRLRATLEVEKGNEVKLEADMARLSYSSSVPGASFEGEKLLQQKLDLLLREREAVQMRRSDTASLARDNKDTHKQALRAKAELTAKVRDLEGRISQLKKTAQGGFEWDVDRKKIVREIVQADTRNQDLRGQVTHLREDIALLKEQIGRLERRASFIQGKKK